MKLRLVSDLHLEWAPLALEYAGEDLLIAAGDIAPGIHGLRALQGYARHANIPALMIAGNHEFYGGHWEDTLRDLRAAADHTDRLAPGALTFAENASICYGGVDFIAATLWTDCRLFGDAPLARQIVQHALNDYRKIGGPINRPLLVTDTIARHGESRTFILDALSRHSPLARSVVVTHHAPSAQSVAERYRADRVSAAYASTILEYLDPALAPELWLHGHTHTSFDYLAGRTRVVCNPRGYVDENPDFDPVLIIGV